MKEEVIGKAVTSLFNDDVLREILSFLPFTDLNNIYLSNKSLRFCQLATEDQLWKTFYHERSNSINFRVVKQFLAPCDCHFRENWTKHLRILFGSKKLKTPNPYNNRYFTPKDVKALVDEKMIEGLKKDIRVAIIGSGSAGKTTFCMRLQQELFPTDYVPTVYDVFTLNRQYLGQQFNITVEDTAGSYEYDLIRQYQLIGCDLILLALQLFSSEDPSHALEYRFIPEIYHHCGNIPIILLGLKKDLGSISDKPTPSTTTRSKHTITPEQGEALAKKYGCLTFTETSSLLGTGFDDVVELMVKAVALFPLQHAERSKKCSLQ